MSIRFAKMHGLGNDFVLIDCTDGTEYAFSDMARRLCDRRRGVGADGLLVVLPSVAADCRMRIFNADGSEAQMCGNGIRCVGKYIHDNGLVASPTPAIETLAGIKTLRLETDIEGKVQQATVDMGAPEFRPSMIPADVALETMAEYPLETSAGTFRATGVSMGNPHGVVFVDSVATFPVATVGPLLECHEIWPEKANIEFVQVDNRHNITQRTWERGVGETQACGTGACAAAAAAAATNRAEFPITVNLTGGQLLIDREPHSGHLIMTGHAALTFTGIFEP